MFNSHYLKFIRTLQRDSLSFGKLVPELISKAEVSENSLIIYVPEEKITINSHLSSQNITA